MYLGTRASKIRAKHDYPGCCVREFLAASLEAILEELDITTTAVTTLLVLDLVLYDEGLVGEGDGLIKWGRDSVVCSLALCNKTLVTLNDGDQRVLDFPLADVAEGLTTNGSLLGCFRGHPTFCPVIGELLNERSLDSRGLRRGEINIYYA